MRIVAILRAAAVEKFQIVTEGRIFGTESEPFNAETVQNAEEKHLSSSAFSAVSALKTHLTYLEKNRELAAVFLRFGRY
jgi:hypothetical protein